MGPRSLGFQYVSTSLSLSGSLADVAGQCWSPSRKRHTRRINGMQQSPDGNIYTPPVPVFDPLCLFDDGFI
ncbi:uncharacterized protein EI90DRAFT_3032447 [Cantharellus anzutake]|uniref:uncharacterized protein n=1 Tax=Cantharellus anzutake TaxID=1750568 RepID=UPI00190677A8|nr:uncharacterized protein EI90DRAFT_3032447 [Cantharellus anzutake]KAF8342201.1 hypothetical protein EI90DRAFT_3032447 [Cantharellus anzutake]